MISDENDEEITVNFKSYVHYFTHYYGGLPFMLMFNISMIAWSFCKIGGDYYIGRWFQSEPSEQKEQLLYYSLISFGFTFANWFAIFLRCIVFLFSNYRAAKKLHEKMLEHTFNAPVNLYFDITPIGRILNKFSKDLNGLEQNFGMQLGTFAQ